MATIEELEAEIARLRGPFRCCKHCPEDVIHDVEPNTHDLPCTICEDTLRARAEAAEAKVARVEAKVAELEDFAKHGEISSGIAMGWRGGVEIATHNLRAAIADAPAEQRAGGGA